MEKDIQQIDDALMTAISGGELPRRRRKSPII